jgi:hypothetical protein
MKLIIRSYLGSLRERGELDVILPDLLSQLGLNVISRPGRGTRQSGVDVAAVGSLDDGPEKVYLFAIKAGNLTRTTWNVGEQSLRSSLDEIQTYIRNRLPDEHRNKLIVICTTVGGEITEPVRDDLRAYEEKNTTTQVSFIQWNGDKLAELTSTHLLREELLPTDAQSQLRKALAMLEVPDTSYAYFQALIRNLANIEDATEKKRLTALRQMSVCLWIVLTWARDANNLEAVYRSAEWALLHAWEVLKPFHGKNTKASQEALQAFLSLFQAYQQVSSDYFGTNVLPFADKLHALSFAIASAEPLDVNLKLFDILGRLALHGIWAHWYGQKMEDPATAQECNALALNLANALAAIVANNPQLFLPACDDQAIDVWLGLSLLAVIPDTRQSMRNWLAEILQRAQFAFKVHDHYPCIFDSYSELLAHPRSRDDEYRQEATAASILYPMISLWAALLGDQELYEKVAAFKRESLEHCNFQFWYPDELSEQLLYTNRAPHGGTLSDVGVEKTPAEFLREVFRECERSSQFDTLSSVAHGWWPLVLVACRLHRLPLPLHLYRQFGNSPAKTFSREQTK